MTIAEAPAAQVVPPSSLRFNHEIQFYCSKHEMCTYMETHNVSQVHRITVHNENHLEMRSHHEVVFGAYEDITQYRTTRTGTRYSFLLKAIFFLLTQQVLPVLHDNAATHDAPAKQCRHTCALLHEPANCDWLMSESRAWETHYTEKCEGDANGCASIVTPSSVQFRLKLTTIVLRA